MLTCKRILLVNDQPDEHKPLVAALRHANCTLTLALDSKDGYHRAQYITPDAIVMNARMPRMDGLATCRMLRADPITRHIPIFIMAAVDDFEARKQSFDAGATDCVIKPFEAAEILIRLRLHLQRAGHEVAQHAPRPPAPHKFDPLADSVLVRAALSYLSTHRPHPPTVAELASQLGTHAKRLSRAFQADLGKSVFEYLRDERLAQSQRLLRDTTIPVSTIAAELGYSSVGNFATAFRKQFNQTPTGFRRSHDPAAVDGEIEA